MKLHWKVAAIFYKAFLLKVVENIIAVFVEIALVGGRVLVIYGERGVADFCLVILLVQDPRDQAVQFLHDLFRQAFRPDHAYN